MFPEIPLRLLIQGVVWGDSPLSESWYLESPITFAALCPPLENIFRVKGLAYLDSDLSVL